MENTNVKLHKIVKCSSLTCSKCHCTECNYARHKTFKTIEQVLFNDGSAAIVFHWQLMIQNAKPVAIRIV